MLLVKIGDIEITEKEFNEYLDEMVTEESVRDMLIESRLVDDNGVMYYNTDRKFTPETHPVVTIDLDNTIWEEDYPHFGELFPYAIETINAMLEEGYEIILWTARGGEVIKKDVEYLGTKGLDINNEKFVVNDHAAYFLKKYPIQSPKANGSIMLDDRAYGAPNFRGYWFILHQEFLGYQPEINFYIKEEEE